METCYGDSGMARKKSESLPENDTEHKFSDCSAALIADTHTDTRIQLPAKDEANFFGRRKLLEQHLNELEPESRDSYKQEMADFEKRIGKNGITRAEVSATYFQINRMFDARLEPPLNHEDARRVGLALLHEAADPEDIKQGNYKTCNVSTTRRLLVTIHPSLAGKIAADALLSPHVTTMPDGQKVVLDILSMKADREARNVGLRDGGYDPMERDQLGQVLDHVLVNSANQEKDSSARYTSRADDHEVLKKGNKVYADPELSGEDLANLNYRLTGRKGTVFIPNTPGRTQAHSPYATYFDTNNQDDLEHKLNLAYQKRNFPVGILVDSNDPLFAGKNPGMVDHIVSITDVDRSSKNRQYRLCNQWLVSSNQWVDPKRLYLSTLDPIDRRMQAP